ncbi:MAG: cytidylate kinase-like family protein [Desulfatibacillum sp.]|nr:cytidylate kinase-like family protein [Desulfatibacillum sp.]
MSEKKYQPGYYDAERPDIKSLVDRFFQAWEKEARAMGKEELVLPPNICFSRKIGVGALEIADLIAQDTGLSVMDREIIEYISIAADLSTRTVKIFDERYPGTGTNFFNMILGEGSFVLNDFSRQLAQAIVALAGLGPLVFVGRGAHLFLPRDRVLAVRLVGTKEYRVKRVASIMGQDEKVIKKEIDRVDSEQAQFFKKVFGRSDAPNEEFDLVIVRDHFQDSRQTATLIKQAYEMKFGPLPK